MEKEKLINRLNWFYAFEVTQVDNYIAQSKMVKDKHISLALIRFASIEQEHVDNISAYINKLGQEPTQSRDTISSYLNKLVGNVTPVTGVVNMLRINVAVEQKAKADCKKLIDVYPQHMYIGLLPHLITRTSTYGIYLSIARDLYLGLQ